MDLSKTKSTRAIAISPEDANSKHVSSDRSISDRSQELSKEANNNNNNKNPALVLTSKEPIMRRNIDNQAYYVLGHKTPNIRDLYTLRRKLRQGQCGTTHLCTEIATGADYACKSISKRKLISKEDVEVVRREIQIMHHVAGHANIVTLKGAYEDLLYVHIVMELCAGGEFFDRIIQRGHYCERKAAELTKIIVGVVEVCHSLGVMHRDLKPEKFLLVNKDDDLSLKAIDFELSVFFKPGQIFTDVVGSLYYVAPEVLLKRHGPEADVWSAGVILYILLSGVPPFWAETEQGVFDAVLKGYIDFESDPWPVISDSAKDLIRRMLCSKPADRLTAHEVLRHPWICENCVAPDRALDPAVLSRLKQFSAMNKLKKMALKVIAESLSEEEIGGVREMFQAMDTDNSGAITFDELKAGLRKYGSTLKDTEIHDLMEAADVDNSGTIDYSEFIAATIHLNKLEREEHLVAALQYFDKNGSGYITIDELLQACVEHSMTDAFLEDVIKEVDQNADGKIDYGEFVEMMQKGNDGVGRRTMRKSLNISMRNDGNTMSSSSSSSYLHPSSMPSSLTTNWKYDVFPSFHGPDVRRSFLSHIFKELMSRGVRLFIDDDIKRSNSIGPELIEAIRGSRIAIVMLSRNYVTSLWCLNALVEIMKCREELGQLVVPIFCEVDPTDINFKKQIGDAFRNFCKGKPKEDIKRWKQALVNVSAITGYHSSRDDEGAITKSIATHISYILNVSTPHSDFQRLDVIDAPIENWGPVFNLYSSSDEESAGDVSKKGGSSQVWETYNQKMDSDEETMSDGSYKFDSFEPSSDYQTVRPLGDILLEYSDEGTMNDGSNKLNIFEPSSDYQPVQPLVSIGNIYPEMESDEETIVEEIMSDGSNKVNDSAPSSEFHNLVGKGAHIDKMKHMLGLMSKGFHYFWGKSKEQDNVLTRSRTSVDGHSLCGEDKNIDECEVDSEADDFIAEFHSQQKKQGQESSITCQDRKEDLMDYCSPSTSTAHLHHTTTLYTSERALEKTSYGLLHAVHIYCLDTLQNSFPSHLSMEFRRKGIYAPVNYNGTDLDVIEGVSASVVVFSKNYLSSTSCLDKLVGVLQCRRKTGQVVIPVFYGIMPSDVVLQEGESADRTGEWSSAVQEVRELPGYIYSWEECSESELVEEIVKDVYEKLFPAEQIGINSRLLEIEQLLCKLPWGIRRIGIWGMPGIGKTTLAKAVFELMSGGYEASCFIKHFDKAFHEKGRHRLLEEHFRDVLKELPRECSSITRPSLTGNKLSKKRTLVVLDDVHNPLVAESFLGGFHWFGPGSLIIITSRDKKVFRLCQISHVYEVCSLDENEALQLFSQCVFVKDIREQNLLKLSMEVVNYSSGNPSVLSFYGKELKGKKLSEMETTFLKLKRRTPYRIYDLFKSSYETLNDIEKNIFLDIACFFNGENVEYVMQLLDGCGFFPYVGINVLVEKCLVIISENKVKMHSIIQDFGREIINRETVQIERRRRLWEPWTIKYLLEDDKPRENEDPKVTHKRGLGTEDIEVISLDISNLLFDVKPSAFEDMLSLRFLKIYCSDCESDYGLRLTKGLESLPNKLRLLHWDDYPLQSLPQGFDPSHLVELDMSFTQLRKLWGGTKNLDKLKTVRLCHSKQLTEIDDICRAPYIELINLQGCTKLKTFPATGQLQHLRVIDLSGCREINSFSEISSNIEELYLQGTGIEELPISIGNATYLQILDVSNCSNLVELPVSFGNAINLKQLYLHGCSSLVKLPASIGNAVGLEILDLSNCLSLMELPSSFEMFLNLRKLYLAGCSGLQKLPLSFGNAINLKKINLRGCSSLIELPASLGNATNLEILDLCDCSSLLELPSSFGFINLKELYLTGCSSLVELPASIGNVANLEILVLSNCSSLVELPDSFGNGMNIKELDLSGCSSLVELPSSFGNVMNLEILNLSNCSSIVELPSSFEYFKNLKELYLIGCSRLVKLSFSFVSAINLKKLFLTGCSSLVDLPASFGNAINLKELCLDGCSSLLKLPLSFGNAISLKKLYLRGCSRLIELSALFGNTSNLEILNLSDCSSLLELPASIGNATKLKTLDLSECSSLLELPSSFGNFMNLKELYLTGCSSLVKLPASIGNVANLEILDLSNCSSLVELPNLFENGINIKELDLSECSCLVELPSSFGNAMNLEILNLSNCSSLVELPSSFGNFKNLKELYLSGCSRLVKLSFSFGNAINLKKLFLTGCSSLVDLPASFENAINLKELCLDGCSSLVKLPFSFGNAISLEKLYLRGCSSLIELSALFGDITNLEILNLSNCSSLLQLSASLGNATKLKTLDLSDCSSLMELPSSFGNFINLKELYLTGCSGLVKLPASIGNATNLEILVLSNCSSLVEVPSSFGKFINLEELYLTGCLNLVKLPFSFGNAINLKKLHLTQCSSLVELPDSFGNASNIKELDLGGCSRLIELPSSFGNAVNVEILNLSNCSNLMYLPASFKNFKNLKKLYVTGCSSLENLPLSFGNASNLEILDLSDCSSLLQLPASFGNATNIEILDLSDCSSLMELPSSFGNFINLKELYLTGCSSLFELSASLENAANLEILVLSKCSSLVKLPSFGNFMNLKELNFTGCSSLVELPSSFGNAASLEKLYLRGCSSLVKLPESIENFINLEILDLTNCSSLVELPSSFGNFINLKELYLTGCSSLMELPSSFGNLNLKEVYLTGCSSLVKLPSSFGNFTNLKELYLIGCTSLVELPTSIGNATNLEILDLSNCSSLVELPSSIGSVTNLQYLNLEYCSSLVKLPSSLGNATNLKTLCFTGCSRLAEFSSSISNSTSLMSTDLIEDDKSGSRRVEVRCAKGGKLFVLKGEQNDEHSVSLILRVEDENGRVKYNHFLFNQKGDTAYNVSTEVVTQLEITDQNVMLVAELLDILLVNMTPTETEVTDDRLIHLQLNQNSRSHRIEAKTQRQEETAFHDACKPVSNSHLWTSNLPRLDEEDEQYVDASKVEGRSSSQDAEKATEPASSKEEERLRQELEEIEARYQEEMKEMARKREEAIMDTRKKLFLMKERTT